LLLSPPFFSPPLYTRPNYSALHMQPLFFPPPPLWLEKLGCYSEFSSLSSFRCCIRVSSRQSRLWAGGFFPPLLFFFLFHYHSFKKLFKTWFSCSSSFFSPLSFFFYIIKVPTHPFSPPFFPFPFLPLFIKKILPLLCG